MTSVYSGWIDSTSNDACEQITAGGMLWLTPLPDLLLPNYA